MRRTKFQRITALALALVFVLCAGISVSAADASSNASQISEIKELLNSVSYNAYLEEHKDVPKAESEIVINAADAYEYVALGGQIYTQNSNTEGVELKSIAHVTDEYGAKRGLYVPGTGTVTWKTDAIKTAAKYSIVIDYYPVQEKSAAIERVFMVNGSVPFAEARYLTISKVWSNAYSDGSFLLPEGESADTYIQKGAAMGITVTSEQRDSGTYIVYKMPSVWTKDISNDIDDHTVRFFTEDIDRNEIRASLKQTPEWTSYEFRDSNGFFEESFEFVLAPDENGIVSLSLKSVNEPIAIAAIRLVPHEGYMSYEEYIKMYENEPEGTDSIKMEAEYFSATSSQTIYPLEDRTSAITSPSATDRTVLNTIGGEKWQTSGQWVTYKFEVSSSGLYEIAARFRQAILDGMFVSRALYIYSDSTVAPGEKGYYNGIPFSEAARLQFGYSSDWQSGALNDGELEDGFKFYFKEGVVYTLKIEVTLGSMGKVVNTVQSSLDTINNCYLDILKLTGSNPDEYRDYNFNRIMPNTMVNFVIQSRTLYSVAAELSEIAGDKSSMTATLEKVARLLETMSDEDEVAKNLEQLKTNIGTLGTWIGDAKTQPLQLDYIVVQSPSAALPEAEAGFFKAFKFELTKFLQSFFRNYDRMGALVEIEEGEAVEVWLAYGRDQSQVIRSLINNDFTPVTGVAIDLKLVAGGTLLPSILSGKGPDVYIGIGQGDVINYAIRGALLPIDDMADFDEALTSFNDAAMIVLGITGADGVFRTYGLPETQGFNMMFVREDILAELDIEIPKTWDAVLEAIPVLQANNMQIGMHTDYKVFLYQMNGELYADDGMRINLDSNVALNAFNTMCNMFTMYSFPYKYDFANRFRTGEMPIGFATYNGTYNQLKVFATEIEGLWGFYPMPGYYNEETGVLNNVSVSSVSAIVMIKGCQDKEGAWEFMKWHAGAQCQIDYSNEMVALIGPSAKHATANIEALASLPWTNEEYTQLKAQFDNLASIPNYPGSYIIDRYTNFAFLDAYNEGADPVEELRRYIITINKEITRKRNEFGLEVLEDGQTLAQKRMGQALDELNAIKEGSSYSASYDSVYQRAIDTIEDGECEDYAALRATAVALGEANATLFENVIKYLNTAADSLEKYELYK